MTFLPFGRNLSVKLFLQSVVLFFSLCLLSLFGVLSAVSCNLMWVLFVFLGLFALFILFFIVNFFSKRAVFKVFKKGNVLLGGVRGDGKDMLFCLAVNYFKRNYISNVQYSDPNKKYQRFDFDPKVWELAKNDHSKFLNNEVSRYSYPYPDGLDYYISDASIYFPSAFSVELSKKYPTHAMFQALSRHLGDCNVHLNTQKIDKLWDKMRDQSDLYMISKGCHVFRIFPFKRKFVRLKVSIYDKFDTAVSRVKMPFFGIGKGSLDRKNAWILANGDVKTYTIYSKLPYCYDSRRFKTILANGCVDYENNSK